MLDELFAQHPLPWRADCALTEFEAYAVVRDANENVVWGADDDTAQRVGRAGLQRADILLAHAIAALPDLIACCAQDISCTGALTFADDLDVLAAIEAANRPVIAVELEKKATRIRAALDKAGATKE